MSPPVVDCWSTCTRVPIVGTGSSGLITCPTVVPCRRPASPLRVRLGRGVIAFAVDGGPTRISLRGWKRLVPRLPAVARFELGEASRGNRPPVLELQPNGIVSSDAVEQQSQPDVAGLNLARELQHLRV